MSNERVDLGESVEAYEPPKVTSLGNVRDLLAGSGGTQVDGDPPDEDFPTRPA